MFFGGKSLVCSGIQHGCLRFLIAPAVPRQFMCNDGDLQCILYERLHLINSLNVYVALAFSRHSWCFKIGSKRHRFGLYNELLSFIYYEIDMPSRVIYYRYNCEL